MLDYTKLSRRINLCIFSSLWLGTVDISEIKNRTAMVFSSRSLSLYAIARPSVCLSSICLSSVVTRLSSLGGRWNRGSGNRGRRWSMESEGFKKCVSDYIDWKSRYDTRMFSAPWGNWLKRYCCTKVGEERRREVFDSAAWRTTCAGSVWPPAFLSELRRPYRTAASQMLALSYQYTDGVAFVLTLRLSRWCRFGSQCSTTWLTFDCFVLPVNSLWVLYKPHTAL